MQLPQKLNEFIQTANATLASTDFSGKPAALYEPIEYLLSIGGKRLRPALVLLGGYLVKDDIEALKKPSLAVEVFHNFTLMHDDIMDNAPLRRGNPTVHEKWGANTAILSGDAMFVQAYQMLAHVDPELLPWALDRFNQTALEVCEGQQFDMNFEERQDVTIEEYLNMIRLKTAVLVGFSLQLGAKLNGASEEFVSNLYDFGLNLGIGFQLKDDLLDVYGDQQKFGKQVGGDIIANKKTYLLITAMQHATGAIGDELNHWLELEEFDSAEKVSAVKEIYAQLDIQPKTEQAMNAYFDKALNILPTLDIPAHKKDDLKGFAEFLIGREV